MASIGALNARPMAGRIAAAANNRPGVPASTHIRRRVAKIHAAPQRESRPCRAVQAACETDCGTIYQGDPDFLDFARREQTDQPELPWEA